MFFYKTYVHDITKSSENFMSLKYFTSEMYSKIRQNMAFVKLKYGMFHTHNTFL